MHDSRQRTRPLRSSIWLGAAFAFYLMLQSHPKTAMATLAIVSAMCAISWLMSARTMQTSFNMIFIAAGPAMLIGATTILFVTDVIPIKIVTPIIGITAIIWFTVYSRYF